MTKRERDAAFDKVEEIDKEFGTMVSSDPKRKKFKTKSIQAVVEAFVGTPETPFCNLLMQCTKDLKYAPRWDTYKGEKAEYFFFHNHAAGQLMHVTQKNNISFDKLAIHSSWDPAVLADLKRIGISLPFFFFSLFINVKDMQLLSPDNLELVCFNKEYSKAHLYSTEDPENGRIACNPYFLFMDKFTRYFINTGHFQYSFAQPPILDESQLNKETKTPMSILEGVVFADIYPQGNPQHQSVMEDRKMLLEQTDLLLKDVMGISTSSSTIDKVVDIKEIKEDTQNEMTD